MVRIIFGCSRVCIIALCPLNSNNILNNINVHFVWVLEKQRKCTPM